MRYGRAGKLKHSIAIIQAKNERNEYGEMIEKNVLLFTTRAAVWTRFLKENESVLGTLLQDTITLIVRYKQKMKITNDMLIKFNGDLYEIKNINPDEQKKDFTTIIVKAVS